MHVADPPPEATWRLLAKTHLRGRVLVRHQHRQAQLLFATRGVMQVKTDHGQWTLPPQCALWIAPAVAHSVLMLSDTSMRTIYFASTAALPNSTVHMVRPTALLRELILALFEPTFGAGAHAQIVALLLRLVHSTKTPPNHLPLPTNPVLLNAAQWVMANRLWNMPLTAIAAKAHMTERSFTRHFSADVGISFRDWRQRARIATALDRVVAGEPIKSIAHLSGFATASAFVAAFKQMMACTPTQFTQYA